MGCTLKKSNADFQLKSHIILLLFVSLCDFLVKVPRCVANQHLETSSFQLIGQDVIWSVWQIDLL